jgi:thiamine biosynthesis lipoprotein
LIEVKLYTAAMAARTICALLLLALAGGVQAARIHDARPLMGTVVEISAEGAAEERLRAAAAAAFAAMGRLSAMMNHYDPASAVSEINRAAGERAVRVPRELMDVLRSAQAVSRRTNGAFDVTIGALRGWRFRADDPAMPSAAQIEAERPLVDYRRLVLDERASSAFLQTPGMRIDLGGIAKLYILEAGVRVLAREAERALVNGGGDVAAWTASGSRPWRVGVRDPRAPGELAGVVELSRGFVASSGDYERYFERGGVRYHHILDPRTGQPARGGRGVTLVAERLEDVNGLGVAIMVLGRKEAERIAAQAPQVDILMVDASGSVWLSPGMRARLKMR